MTSTIPGFDYHHVTVADGVALNVAVGGSGSPIVLLHGFPQTHLMWRHVATELADQHTVICPDLRGYGASDKPAERDHEVYSKRTMAADIVTLAESLGVDRFALAGHDRGALVAIRAGLDHPGRITHLASLDVLPTLDMWEVLHGADAAVAFHLYLMAQPAGLPEQMIVGSADAFFGYFLDAWTRDATAIPAEVRAEYLRASREAVPSIVADYRASAGVDIEHDRKDRAAGNRLTMPVTVIQQDWGAALGFDAVGLWQNWAVDLDHTTLDAGHFMAEEAPGEIIRALRELLAR
ncbi:alpha/beta hydrolase [Nocardia cyriacigeorgica]|uniref:Alpha/beta hydrolase n=1 Tax=Nocardia cyriacigeorgica TaxID=135487 RepID=A0A6P1D2F3_9NOCA|nr:alpha/beta hydrolase [Nocardia cyriacigeorgica]NEW38435.1 alpha/beta hydrolase [Nocardia cyriacigeorgica]NEW43601.1 alpha/beta hydrolase [Nocardia cyriacigeorgica]NEW49463.1 alpha/beta hydrolase [Nocardia cyriacigeorgica]NEW54133.1 alpha/beta hydrolase [Nocardia cyriacigeorgica]